jgi:hypothetical protein
MQSIENSRTRLSASVDESSMADPILLKRELL